MEIEASYIVLSIALVSLLTCLWKLVNWVWLKPKQLEKHLREQGFTVNPYKFLYGDAKQLISMMQESKSMFLDPTSDDIISRILPHHNHWINLHGDNYCIWIGPTPRVNISDPKLIREVLFNYDVFRKATTSNPYVKLLVTGLLGYEGKKWSMHRSLVNPAFKMDKLKHMVSSMNSCCKELIRTWDGLVSLEGSRELDVWPYLGNFTADVISRTAFGSSYEEGKMIFQLQREQISLTLQILRSMYIPGSRFLLTKTNKRLKTIYEEMGTILRDIIDKKARAIKEGGVSDDLLGILLRTISGENQELESRKNLMMTIEEVVEECKLFYIAGQETTSVLLVWTMVLLSKNQKWQNLARDEVLEVFGDSEPDIDRLGHLKTISMILNEVLRLYPPAAITTRRVHRTVKLGEYVLPAGVEISMSFISVHHDHNIWGEDAREFNPGRFSEGISKAAKVQGTFLAFSGGPRICIGQNFSMIEAKIALVMILRRFSFELGPSYVHAPTLVLTIQPQHGAHLILRRI